MLLDPARWTAHLWLNDDGDAVRFNVDRFVAALGALLVAGGHGLVPDPEAPNPIVADFWRLTNTLLPDRYVLVGALLLRVDAPTESAVLARLVARAWAEAGAAADTGSLVADLEDGPDTVGSKYLRWVRTPPGTRAVQLGAPSQSDKTLLGHAAWAAARPTAPPLGPREAAAASWRRKVLRGALFVTLGSIALAATIFPVPERRRQVYLGRGPGGWRVTSDVGDDLGPYADPRVADEVAVELAASLGLPLVRRP